MLLLILCSFIICLGFGAITLAGHLAKKAADTLKADHSYLTSTERKNKENRSYQKIMSAVILGFLGTYLMILGTLLILK